MEIVNLTGSLAPSSDESMTPFEVTLKSGDDVRLVFTIEPARPTQTLTAATCRFQLAQSAFSDPLVEKVATAESALVVHVDLARADTLSFNGPLYAELAAQGVAGDWTTMACGTIEFQRTLIRA